MLAVLDRASVVVLASIEPARRRAEHLGVVWPWDGRPVVMVEDDVPIPRDRWEFRSHGLWVEQVCEEPMDHWSYGLESFALEIDGGSELVHTGRGTRVPLGWELDFDATHAARWLLTDTAPVDEAGCYTQRGSVHGVLLGAAGQAAVEGPAQRWHWWGDRPLAAAGIRLAADEPQESVLVPLRAGAVRIARSPGLLVLDRPATLGDQATGMDPD